MRDREFRLRDGKNGAALAVRVIPQSENNELGEVLDDGTIKILLQNVADDAGLNRALLEFLSSVLDVPAEQLDVIAGQGSLDKLISIINLDAPSVQDRILKNLS
jgi:uncharacterized protein YggU (UPF0235/DUF167 family)